MQDKGTRELAGGLVRLALIVTNPILYLCIEKKNFFFWRWKGCRLNSPRDSTNTAECNPRIVVRWFFLFCFLTLTFFFPFSCLPILRSRHSKSVLFLWIFLHSQTKVFGGAFNKKILLLLFFFFLVERKSNIPFFKHWQVSRFYRQKKKMFFSPFLG